MEKEYLKLLDENAELLWRIERKDASIKELTTTGLILGEQNRKMKESLFAITKEKGIGSAKMIAQSVLKEIQIKE